VLVVDGEEFVEKGTRRDPGVQAEDECDGRLEFVPVGDVAGGFHGADAHEAQGDEGQQDE
jgi:hypothetical protein